MTETTTRRFSKNLWALTVSNIMYRVVSIGVAMYLGRALGAAVLGEYATVMNVLTLFLSFADLGVTNYVIKKVSKEKSLSAVYLNNFFALQILVGIAVMLGIVTTGFLSGYPALLLLALAIGSIGPFFSGLSNAYNALLNAHEQIHPFAYIEIICLVVYTAGNLLVIVMHQGLTALITVTVVVSIVKYLVGREWSKRYALRVRWEIDWDIVRRLLVMGLPFLVINGAHFAIQRLDVLFLSWTSSQQDVGIYAAASRLIFASLFLINAVGTALYPVFSRLLAEDPERARSLFRQVNTYMFGIGNLTGLLFYYVAPFLLRMLYGPGFEDSVPVLRLLAWFIPLYAYGILSNIILMVGDGVRYAVLASISGVLVMIVVAVLGIPAYGLRGAAYSVLAGESAAFLVFVAGSLRQHSGIFEWSKVIATFFCLAVTLIIINQCVFVSPVVQSILGILVYLVLSFVLKIVSYSDVRELLSLVSGRTGAR